MTRRFQKDPDAVLDYGIDWSSWLSSGEAISSSSWNVSGTGLTVENSTFSSNATVVWLSGGDVGKTYALTNRITTDQGRTDDRTIYVYITQR